MFADLFAPVNYGFPNISAEEYFSFPALNSSSLKLGDSSPYHIDCAVRGLKELDENGEPIDEEKKHFLIGGAYHTLIFEPELFESRYIVFDRSKMPQPDKDFRTKENKEWKKAIEREAEQSGKKLIDSKDYYALKRMRDGLTKRTAVRNIIESKGKHEHTMIWKHPEFGINCKGRIDKLLPNAIIDIKTAQSCSKNEFSRAWEKYKYKYQAAFYHEGYKTLTEKDLHVVYILQEKTYPYYAREFIIDPARLEKAKTEYYPYIEEYISYLNGTYDDTTSEVF